MIVVRYLNSCNIGNRQYLWIYVVFRKNKLSVTMRVCDVLNILIVEKIKYLLFINCFLMYNAQKGGDSST